jgi:hypothetical protein
LLADAMSPERRLDFARLAIGNVELTPAEFIGFLNRSAQLATERSEDRPWMTGDSFLM